MSDKSLGRSLVPRQGLLVPRLPASAARDIADDGRPAVIYLFGDYDASGRDIIRFVRESLREYASEVDPDVSIDFRLAAVTEPQIREWSLPSHPAKPTDSRHRRYGIDHAVELEAIDPGQLRGLVRTCIKQHIDPDAYRRLKTVEEAERDTLLSIAERGCWS
jgi:hypothetical protein